MITASAALALMTYGALLQVQLLPWTPDKSSCFTADVNLDGRAEVCILEEQTLRIFGRSSESPLHAITLPERTAAIDIADVDGDRVADLIAVCEQRVLRYRLEGDDAREPEALFAQQNQFSRADGYPFPAVLVVDQGDGPLIAIPTDSAMEVRSLDGQLVNSYPIGVNAPYHVSIGKPFTYWVNQHSQSGPTDALEYRVNSLASYKPLLPDDAFPIDVADSLPQRLGLNRQQWEADANNPDSWPWFNVARTESDSLRALYRQAASHPDSTIIRIRSRVTQSGPGSFPGDELGPPRVYPGSLVILPDSSPDFNGDGKTDLVLWKSPQPGLTADSLARALANQRWPVNITTHAYMPEKKRFSPKPQSLLSLELPLAWFLSPALQGPLRAVVLRDFTGDAKTDLACLTAEDTLTVWRAEGDGLMSTPAFEIRLPAAVDEVMFESDLDGQGTTSIAVRCGDHLAILRPKHTLPSD